MPQVVHILDSGALGGGPRVLLATAHGLQAHGWTSRVYCGGDGPLAENAERSGIAAVRLPINGQMRFARAVPGLVRRLRRERPDAVIVYGPIAGALGGPAARVARIPTIIYSAQYPAYYADTDPARRLRNALVERTACRSATTVWCISAGDRDDYIARRAAPPQKLQLVSLCFAQDLMQLFEHYTPSQMVARAHGASEAPNADLRRQLGIAPERAIIGFVGRLVPEKGVDVLMRAYSSVLTELPETQLLLAGDGTQRAELERLAQTLGISEHVTFAGAQRDIAPFYLLADLMAAPSRYEPFGMVAVEAMAAWRPVVATRVHGFSDSVVDGVCGRLVPPEDPATLASALVALLRSPAQMEQMGRAGHERALTHFTEAVMAARVDQLLRVGAVPQPVISLA